MIGQLVRCRHVEANQSAGFVLHVTQACYRWQDVFDRGRTRKKVAGANEIDVGKLTTLYDIKLTFKRSLNETLVPLKSTPEVFLNTLVVGVNTFTSSPV